MEAGGLMDAILVPSGLVLLILYHVQLAYRLCKHPTTTVIGINQINRQLWVRIMMQDGLKNGVLAVQTLRNNIMASTLLATAAITLCSVIAMLVSSGNTRLQETGLLLGDKSPEASSAKLLCVLVCFLVAFMCNVQSVRYYSHVSFLVSIPVGPCAPGLNPEYVNKAIIRGGQFWSIGLRAFYFSLPLFLWLFGPIPMFLCSAILTVTLHFLDTSKEFKQTFDPSSLPPP